MPPKTRPPADRVLDRCIAGPNACVLWTGRKSLKGYGSIRVEQRSVAVHRVVYEAFKGQIPAGLEIDHLCRVRHCVNPHHLEAVTHAENLRRRILNTHCGKGHEFTPENTIRKSKRSGTQRACRACQNGWNSAYQARRNAAVVDRTEDGAR